MPRIALAILLAGFALTTTVGCGADQEGPVTPVDPVLPDNSESTPDTDDEREEGEGVLAEEGP